ncbi:PHD finger protein [Gracilaria domingensis]|nr:PHD finger protein [Gracilaria domingensis]
MVTPLRMLRTSETGAAENEEPKPPPPQSALRPLVMPSNDLPQKGELRDVTRLSPSLQPVSKDSVTVITSQSPSPRPQEHDTVDLRPSPAPAGDESVGNTNRNTISLSHSATSVADVNAETSAAPNQQVAKMPIAKKVIEGRSLKVRQIHPTDSYSDKSSERNSDQDQRTAADDESKYHTPRSRSSRDANRSSGKGSRRSTKARGRRSRRRPILITDLDSEENEDANDSEREASDGGVHSIGDEDEEGNSGTEVTRCPCGSKENSGIMIACDQCDTWQHGKCMGFRRNADLPERYFCHICRPDQVRPNCIAHPKYKERCGRDREGKDSRAVEAESLLANIRPTELRKVFMSDLRNRKSPVRSRTDVFNRYASLFKTQFPKNRQAVVEGLSVILDLTRSEASERLESALKRSRSERPQEDDVDRKRNCVGNELDHTEPSNRNAGSGRTHGQKRVRSSIHDGAEGGTVRHDTSHVESGVEIDLNSDSRGMSREERKLQQTMKLFARMEERERERKRPRTSEQGSSPRTSPPGRLKASRSGSQVRGSASKSNVSPSAPENEEVGVKAAVSDVRQQQRSAESKQKRHVPEPMVPIPSEPKQLQKPQPLQSQPDAEQAGTNYKMSNTARTGGEPARDIGRREKDSRSKDRIETPVPNRKDSVSPDSHNFGNRRRKHMFTEKVRSNENKRRRTGSSIKDIDKRLSIEKEFPEPEKPVDLGVYVVGPSVLGSKTLTRERVSRMEREHTGDKEANNEDENKPRTLNSNRKEWLLMKERRITLNKSVGIEPEMSPVKKRVLTERRINEIEEEERRANDETGKDETAADQVPPTVSVSMVVVSEKRSLPDNGQILESTRLVLSEDKKDTAKREREKGKAVIHALKKRPAMLTAAGRGTESEKRDLKPIDLPLDNSGEDDSGHGRDCIPLPLSPKPSPKSPTHSIDKKSSKPPTPTLRMPSPQASTPKHVSTSFLSGSVAAETPSSPRQSPFASPKLRSSPLPSFKSAIRSTTKSSLRESRSPSPLLTIEKKEPQCEKGPVVAGKATQNSGRRSSSPTPERQACNNPAPRSSTPQSQGCSELKKTEAMKAEQDKSLSETLAKKPERKAMSVSPEDEVISEVKRRRGESTDPSPVPTPTTTAPLPISRSSALPLNALRSIRSMPVAEIRKSSLAQNSSNNPAYAQKPKGNESVESSKADAPPSSGATISDVFQRRLEGFWKPAAKTPVKPPAKPNSAPPTVSSIKGSTAKLGAALPLSSKPNLDSLRNSTGLSPRVSGAGNGYHRGSGPSFRSKSMDYERSRGSMPSFSQSKRSHSFSHGRGYPRSGPHGLNSAKPSFHDDRRRFGPIRDSGHHGRDEDKGKNGGTPTQLWSRSYTYRNSRPNISEDHERNMNRRPGGGPPDSDGLRRSRKPIQDSWVPMGGPRQSAGFLGMNGGSNRRMNGDNHGRGSRRTHGHPS